MRRHSDSEEAGTEFEEARCTAATPQAVLVEQEDLGEVWIPKSCVHDDSEVWEPGHAGRLVVKSWFAEKQGWA